MRRNLTSLTAIAMLSCSIIAPNIARAQPISQSPATSDAAYVALVDLSLAAPVIVRATVSRSSRISGDAAAGLPAGQYRLLIKADVEAALVAPGTVPGEISWLQDVLPDARGRAPDLKGQRVIAWVQPPSGNGQTSLVAGNGAQPWSEPLEARVRAIATEIKTSNVPVVTGVSNGFRVTGTIPGEAESQFFLDTADHRPLTMVVLDRPGQARRIQVASTDIIDESATSVQPETLLWYRLACALPARLPVSAGGSDRLLSAAWSSAMTSLGACTRP